MVEDSGQWADSYVHRANLAPFLNREEALLLARRANHGDSGAKSDLIASNRRLVVSIARLYVKAAPSEDEWETRTTAQPPDPEQLAPLLTRGERGLHAAVDRYDESKGFAFPTYATWWIRQAIAKGMPGGDPGEVREPRSPAPPGSPSGTARLDLPSTAS